MSATMSPEHKTAVAIFFYIGLISQGGVHGDSATSAWNCPQNWVKVGQHCLLFQNNFPLTWSQAVGTCKSMASTLLRFESGDDLKAFAQAASAYPVDGWWTDLNQNGHLGQWTWGQNEEAFNDALIWNTEPDDVKHAENCLAINYAGKLSDDMCSRRHGFICEKANNNGCPNGWLGSATSCYFSSDTTDSMEQLTWQESTAYCSQRGATLFSIDSKDELSYVAKLLHASFTTEHRWWTGVNDQQKEGQYMLPNNQPADVSYYQWDNDNDLSAVERCGIVHSNGHISHEHCDQPYYYVCKLSAPGAEVQIQQQLGCGGYWLRAGTKCYLFSTNNTVTQAQARAFCQQQNADLLKVESLDEKGWLTLHTMRMQANNIWTGLSRKSKTEWMWADGSDANTNLYVQWNSEPNDFLGSEDCAAINQECVYNDVSCFNKAGYICQMDTEAEPCPSGWLSNMNQDSTTCYYISETTDAAITNWWGARDKCVSLAGNNPSAVLLAVRNTKEQTYIKNQLASRSPSGFGWWTDLTDIAVEGIWQFADPVGQADQSLINWGGEPNDYGGHEDCALMYYGGRYNDVNCNAKSNIACEKKIVRLSGNVGGSSNTISDLTLPKVFVTLAVALLCLVTW